MVGTACSVYHGDQGGGGSRGEGGGGTEVGDQSRMEIEVRLGAEDGDRMIW